MPALGIRWTLGVDGISLFMVALTALLIPIGLLASAELEKPKSFTFWMLLLEASVIGVFLALDSIVFFVFFEFVLVPMYFLIAGWGHGNRRYAAMKFFLLHDGRFGVPVRRDPRGRVPAPARHRARSPSTCACSPTGRRRRSALSLGDGEVAVPRVRDRLRGEGAAVPVPHLAARRAHRRADRGLGRAGRRDAEDGHLRLPALRDPDVPAGRGRPRADPARARGDRHHLRRDRRRDATEPETDHRLLVDRAPRLRRARHRSRSRARASPAACSRCCRTVSPPARCSCSSACSTTAATPTSSREFRGLWKAVPVFGGLFVAATFASIGLPGFSGFVGEFLSLLGAFLTSRWYVGRRDDRRDPRRGLPAVGGAARVHRRARREERGDAARSASASSCTVVPLLGLSLFLGFYPKPVLDRLEPSVDALVDARRHAQRPQAARRSTRPRGLRRRRRSSGSRSPRRSRREPIDDVQCAGAGQVIAAAAPVDADPDAVDRLVRDRARDRAVRGRDRDRARAAR